jgi:hypothetical protein
MIMIWRNGVTDDGSDIDRYLARVANVVSQLQVSSNADIDRIRNRADDPRPLLSQLAGILSRAGEELTFLGQRAQYLAADYSSEEND